MVLGALLGGYCGGRWLKKTDFEKEKAAPRFGPRRTILFFCGPALIAWLAIAFAPRLEMIKIIVLFILLLLTKINHNIQSLPFLIGGRVLAGVCSSVNTANCSMLIAQVAKEIILSMTNTMMRRVMWMMALSAIKFLYLQNIF